MIINIRTRTGAVNFTVTLKSVFTTVQSQSVEYVKTMNGQTQAFNRGSTFDKFTSNFTIQGLEADIYSMSSWFASGVGQVTLTTDSGERIFGSGIYYTNPIVCNLLNSGKIAYSRTNTLLAEIPLTVEAVSSNNSQLTFDPTVSAILPTLYYQTPISRTSIKSQNSWSSAEYGSYGSHVEVDQSGIPINSFEFMFTLIQNQEDTAQIEKFYNTQRSTPFVWPSLTCLDLFDGQDIDSMMILGLSTKRNNANLWTTTIKMVTNV